MARPNAFLRALRRFGLSSAELDSERQIKEAKEAGANALAEVQDRHRCTLRGNITTLTLRPRSGTPWLEAELSDGSDTVTLIWMGRREIPGVEAGRALKVTGRVSRLDGVRRMYNPHYELL